MLYFCVYRSEARKVFVGGLAAEVTEKDFADYFSQFGVVKVSSVLYSVFIIDIYTSYIL